MDFYGDLADPDAGGDHLVGQTRRHKRQDLSLALGEPFEPTTQFAEGLILPPARTVSLDGELDRVEQFLIAERLFQELDRPPPSSPGRTSERRHGR